MSGTQAVPAVFEFVYVETTVGLKIQREDDDAGYRRNVQLMEEARRESGALARKIHKAMNKLAEEKKSLRFLKIENDFRFFESGMAGYAKFPTLISDEDATKSQGQPAYYQLSENPRVIVRFKSLPRPDMLTNLKQMLGSLVPAKN